MAVRLACNRAVIDIFYRRVPLTALSVHGKSQHDRHLVSVSQRNLSLQPPKRPAGAFLKFMSAKSSEITQASPGASIGERSKIASQMWHALEPDERNRLKMSANEELQKYRKVYLAFLDDLNDEERTLYLKAKKTLRITKAHRRHKMELKKFGKPKMPANAFMLFVRSSRLERGNAHPTKFMKNLTEQWKQMPAEEKEIYQDDAKMENEKYQQLMATWEERMRDIGREDLIRRKSLSKPKKVISTKAKKKSTVLKKKGVKSKKASPKSSSKIPSISKEKTFEE